jgi:hypothetical protein
MRPASRYLPAPPRDASPWRPRKEAILAARDRLVKANPKLRVVGAHPGRLERNGFRPLLTNLEAAIKAHLAALAATP